MMLFMIGQLYLLFPDINQLYKPCRHDELVKRLYAAIECSVESGCQTDEGICNFNVNYWNNLVNTK